MYDFQSERWNEFELPKLSLRELLALAKLLGCPSCASKEAVTFRLLAHRKLRLKLSRFADNAEELANSYQRESLRTRNIELFIPILSEIDFGDQFLLSMLHWCGIGQRATPLEYWQVFLIRSKQETVGVSGLYRQPGMAAHVCWLGWFAIRPQYRRRGFGSAAIRSLVGEAQKINCREIWVYTDTEDRIARDFYISLDFEVMGSAHECAYGKTTNPSDLVMRRKLVATHCGSIQISCRRVQHSSRLDLFRPNNSELPLSNSKSEIPRCTL
jgi:ribosomal protein S18 acetylase RimI-like enzyme